MIFLKGELVNVLISLSDALKYGITWTENSNLNDPFIPEKLILRKKRELYSTHTFEIV